MFTPLQTTRISGADDFQIHREVKLFASKINFTDNQKTIYISLSKDYKAKTSYDSYT